MLQLYFTRHGETEWNAEKRIQGRLNSNLTANGVLHARLLGKKLASTPFDAVIASPSTRTVETAKLIIGDRPLSIITDERLMEIHLGRWQGKTMAEIKEMDPERYDCYRNHPKLFTNPEGESFCDVRKRVEEVLYSLEETYQSGNLLIVTHGVVIKVLQMICKNSPIDRIWDPPLIEGTSLSVVKVENGSRELILEGDISHKVMNSI
jgi:probable phosphoglycerate mutase